MIYLHRSTLVIAVLTVLLAVILLLPMPERKETMAQPEEAVRRKELTAPVRHIREPLEDEKICYLTFDDGPSENTEKVLDILSEHGAKATFFVIGESLNEEMRPLLQRMREEGHAVGMHANVHSYDRLYRSLDSFLTDYESLYTKLKDEYDIDTAIFRFPGGSACSRLNGRGHEFLVEMEKRGFSGFDWKASGEDSVGKPTVASIRKNVFATGLQYQTPIVLLHDSAIAGKTVEALPEIMRRYEEEGYRFESLENAKSYIFPDSR